MFSVGVGCAQERGVAYPPVVSDPCIILQCQFNTKGIYLAKIFIIAGTCTTDVIGHDQVFKGGVEKSGFSRECLWGVGVTCTNFKGSAGFRVETAASAAWAGCGITRMQTTKTGPLFVKLIGGPDTIGIDVKAVFTITAFCSPRTLQGALGVFRDLIQHLVTNARGDRPGAGFNGVLNKQRQRFRFLEAIACAARCARGHARDGAVGRLGIGILPLETGNFILMQTQASHYFVLNVV